jgi:hypothetical protein
MEDTNVCILIDIEKKSTFVTWKEWNWMQNKLIPYLLCIIFIFDSMSSKCDGISHGLLVVNWFFESQPFDYGSSDEP